MQSHGVAGLLIHAFDDVDLTAAGPVGTNEPEGRPGATACRHVIRVEDEQAGLVGLVARDTNARTAARGVVRAVDTHFDVARATVDKFLAARGTLALVLYEAIGGIRAVPERELVEEVAPGQVVVLENVLSPSSGAHGQEASNECGERHNE